MAFRAPDCFRTQRVCWEFLGVYHRIQLHNTVSSRTVTFLHIFDHKRNVLRFTIPTMLYKTKPIYTAPKCLSTNRDSCDNGHLTWKLATIQRASIPQYVALTQTVLVVRLDIPLAIPCPSPRLRGDAKHVLSYYRLPISSVFGRYHTLSSWTPSFVSYAFPIMSDSVKSWNGGPAKKQLSNISKKRVPSKN